MPPPADTAPRAVTARALGVGAVVSFFIGTAVPYSNMIISGTVMAHNFSTPAALFLFFLLILAVNWPLRWVLPRCSLRRGELAVVYIMAMLATSVPTVGFSENLLPILAGLYYYATPENRWADLIHPHVPDWLAPQDPDAVRHFFEGLPAGLTVPWHAWAMPLVAWIIFILAFYWVCLCAMVILRRQWVEHEKLLYPLVQVPMEMIRGDDGGRRLPPFFTNGVMWAGFAIPFTIGIINGLHSYYEFIPRIELFGLMPMFRDSVVLRVDLNLALVGFAYLVNRDIAAGFWLFFLLSFVQRGLFGMFGVASTENLSRFANLVGPFMAHQAMGAMIVLVLSGLWLARGHLRHVAACAFGPKTTVTDDEHEMLSYRAAVRGLLIGLLVVCCWLTASGFPWWIVPLFLAAVAVVFTAVTRAVVEGGISFIRSPLTPADFVISGLGTPALGASGLIGIAFTYVWASNIRIFFLPCFANALKMTDELKTERRPLLWAVILAVLIALGASIWAIMTLTYQYGGINLHTFWFIFVPQKAFGYIAPKFATPELASASGWAFTALGAALMSLLTFLRYQFVWWPLHPLGFATGTFFIMNWVWFSMLVAWLLKTAILKYGGPASFRQTRPFFLGLILGHTTIAGVWLVVDHFTGMTGNTMGLF